jgi:O-antigen/teichoic acid export membrane protein
MALFSTIKSRIKNPLIQRMVVYAFSDGISKAIPFLIFPLVAAYLTTEEFGYIANFNVFTQLILAFVIINAHTYLSVDYYKSDQNQKGNLIHQAIVFFSFNTVIVLIIVFLVSGLIKKYLALDLFWQIGAVFWSFGMASTYVYQSYLRLNEQVKLFSIFKISQAIFSAGLTFLLVVFYEGGLSGRLYSIVISVFSFGLIGLIYLIRKSNLYSFKVSLKPLYLFGIPLLPHTVSFWIKGGIDKIYITNYISLSANGIYAFAETFMLIFSMFSLAFFSAYTPHLYKQLSSMENGNSLSIKDKIVKETGLFLMFFIVLLIIGYFAVRIFVSALFVEKYGDSLSYLHYMVFSVFVSVLYSIASSYMFYVKKTKILGIINFSGAIIHTFINYFVIQYYGVLGMVITNLIMLTITTSIILFFSQQYYPMPWHKLIPLKNK